MGISPSLLAAAEQTYASYQPDLSVPEIVYAEEVALALAMYQYEAQDEVRRIARSYASLSEYDTKEICRVADFSSTGEFAVILGCRVLVPGCGTGRLAYDVAVLGHDVEANDFDIMKLAAANAVVSRSTDDPFIIEPYCLDTCNRMKRDDHIRKVSVPDCNVDREALGRITVNGFEFTEAYGVPAKHESFDIVLTAAFIDTAPNVFAYIKTIANVLKPGAKWANTGPLGWLYDGDRFNSGRDGKFLRRLELSHEELMEAISAKWFDIERSELVPGCRYCGDRRTMLETDLTFVNFVAIRNNTPG
ncbi:hypothetical protein FOZ60_015180 [Perkinsus olseni]|uniref:carnosine N-methyltransferase n=1 Tax=Perkinsus olseni TaxID=32597 RepID=A0A7J6P8B6_PEROL|nr:hypothetical protein FOZ60_015180 [Perkinsus olseni]